MCIINFNIMNSHNLSWLYCTDGSTETVWESGDEDRAKTKTLTMTVPGQVTARVLSVHIDNTRDVGVSTVSIPGTWGWVQCTRDVGVMCSQHTRDRGMAVRGEESLCQLVYTKLYTFKQNKVIGVKMMSSSNLEELSIVNKVRQYIKVLKLALYMICVS